MSDNESVSNQSPVVKPESTNGEEPQGEDTLSLKVTDGTTDVAFKVKTKTQLKRVMDAFCKRTGKDKKALRFLFDGDRINDEDTPASLGMEDNDTIEALNQQTGGC